MQPIEEILKEFEDQYPEGEYDLDHDKVRAFIEQALIERDEQLKVLTEAAKLERTNEILKILWQDVDFQNGSCGCAYRIDKMYHPLDFEVKPKELLDN